MGEGQLLKDKIHMVQVHFAGRSLQTKLFSFLIQLSGGRTQLGMLQWHRGHPIKQQQWLVATLTLLPASWWTGRPRQCAALHLLLPLAFQAITSLAHLNPSVTCTTHSARIAATKWGPAFPVCHHQRKPVWFGHMSSMVTGICIAVSSDNLQKPGVSVQQ